MKNGGEHKNSSRLLGSRSHQFAIAANKQWKQRVSLDGRKLTLHCLKEWVRNGFGCLTNQIHGLLQSYDLGRCCFRSAAVQKMLTYNPSVINGLQMIFMIRLIHLMLTFGLSFIRNRWEVVRSLRKFAFENDLSPLAMQAAANRCGQHKGFRAYKLPTPDYVL